MVKANNNGYSIEIISDTWSRYSDLTDAEDLHTGQKLREQTHKNYKKFFDLFRCNRVIVEGIMTIAATDISRAGFDNGIR